MTSPGVRIQAGGADIASDVCDSDLPPAGAERSSAIYAGGAYVPTVFVGMYATQGRYDVRVLKHYYGLNHLHYLTTSTYHRARLFDSERLAG